MSTETSPHSSPNQASDNQSMYFWAIWVALYGVTTVAHLATLTDASLGALENNAFSLIYFFRPLCQYCGLFDSVFADLDKVVDHKGPVQLLKCNAIENPGLAAAFAVQYYPTIKLYDRATKKSVAYDGERSVAKMIKFLDGSVDAPISYHLDGPVRVVGPDELAQAENTVVVFTFSFLPDWEDVHVPTHYYQVLAAQHPDINFAVVLVDQTSDGLDRLMISNYPSIVYFKTAQEVKMYKTFGGGFKGLADYEIDQFIRDPDYGQWFRTHEELEKHVRHLQLTQPDTDGYGFHVDKAVGPEDPYDYDQMVEGLEL